MSSSKSNTRSPILPIFLTVFIDMVGIGIIIPVIPALFFNPETSIFSSDITISQRSILYGLLLASYPFMQFFGAPMLGSLSDRYGRKPMLKISLIGTLVGYLLFGIAIKTSNIWLLYFSRMLPGFTGGNIAIILSSISDVSTNESKAKNFGLVGMAFGLGFILGPAIGGMLADHSVVSWFTHATPFWFTAILTFLNILLVQFNFPETLKAKRKTKVNAFQGIANIAHSFSIVQLRTILTVVLLLSLGFTFFTQFLSVYLLQRFQYTVKDTGLLYGWIGIWLAFTQGFIVRRMSGKVAPMSVLSYSIIGLSVVMFVLLIPDKSYLLYYILPLVSICQGITSPNMTAVVSIQAGADRQGEILGINQSMQSVGQIIPPLIAGYINTLDNRLPIFAGALLVFLGWLLYVAVFKRNFKLEKLEE